MEPEEANSLAALSLKLLRTYHGSTCQIPVAARHHFTVGSKSVEPSASDPGGYACTLALPNGTAASCTFVPCLSRLWGGWPLVHEALQLQPGDVLHFSPAAASDGAASSATRSSQPLRFSVSKQPRQQPAQRQPARPSGPDTTVMDGDGSTASWQLPGAACGKPNGGVTLWVAAVALNAWHVFGDTKCDFVLPDGDKVGAGISRVTRKSRGAVRNWARIAKALQPQPGDTLHMRAAPLEPLTVHISLTRRSDAAAAAAEGGAAPEEAPSTDGGAAADSGAAAAPEVIMAASQPGPVGQQPQLGAPQQAALPMPGQQPQRPVAPGEMLGPQGCVT